ncbi:methyl-accepting chemotaxis protein [Candidatus Vecturithrix granuli]|uniref:Methyl-accepting chemotaxis protein n=1 Tax=Vecturithrix granuli TaxID=1499967 RepID=A0A0S6W9X2_VECG1|nr:methyl-accepting chemotaxis protein [Candidatus Vecturithrix granuli]
MTLAIQQLDQVTQHNASMAEELSATADSFTQQAARLWKTITILDSDQQGLPTNPPNPSTPPIEQKHHISKPLPKEDRLDEEFERL